MNKCYFQLWEESERGWGIRPDGCSIHLSPEGHNQYVADIYNIRQSEILVPDEYDRISGKLIECFISDTLFDVLKEKHSMRLMQHELNNLVNLEEIIFKS